MPSTTLGIAASAMTFPEFEIVSGTSTVTSDATYYYRTFNANATFRILNRPLIADIFMVGGGGGPLTSSVGWAGLRDTWETSGGLRSTYMASGGASGATVRQHLSKTLNPSGLVGSPSATFTVTIGAGGYRSNGTDTNFATPSNYEIYSPAYGGRMIGGGYGADNNDNPYSGRGTGANSYWNIYQYGYFYSPFFGLGGGGAGATGSGTAAVSAVVNASTNTYGSCGNGGPGFNAFDGIRYGDGSGGTPGGYVGGTDYFGTYYGNAIPVTFVSSGSSGGSSAGTSGSTGTSAPANRGGAGGAGWNDSGSGGSGRLVIRYLRSAVGG